MKNIFKSLMLLLMGAVIFSCTLPTLEETPVVETEITALPENVVETDSAYIIDGDFAIEKTVENARENAIKIATGNSGDNSKGNLWGYRWSTTGKEDITYRFTTDMKIGGISNAAFREFVRKALYVYQINVDVNFREITSGTADLTISRADSSTADWIGITTINSASGTSMNRVTVQYNNYYMKSRSKSDNMYTIVHELGHAIGLHHEHQRADSSNQYGQGTGGTPYGSYDRDSVMGYENKGRVTMPSSGDISTLRSIYGSNNDIYWGSYVTDLVIISGGSASIKAPPGYVKINVDLNQGAGGAYMYLCYTKRTSRSNPRYVSYMGAVTRTTQFMEPIMGSWNMIFSPNGKYIQPDCNEGAEGHWIYLLNKYSSSTKIKNVSVISGDSGSIQKSGYTRVNVDLNYQAGGKYIYAVYQR